jgi:hypothetical protein
MGTSRRATRWLVVAVVVVVAAALVGVASGLASAAGDKLIYYSRYVGGVSNLWQMATDGSGKTDLGGGRGCLSGEQSDQTYGGVYWSVMPTYDARSGPFHPDGDIHWWLRLAPLTGSAAAVTILDSPYYKPFGISGATFRPGTTPRVTFSAVQFVPGAGGTYTTVAGLFQIDLTIDATGVTGYGAPTLVLAGSTYLDGGKVYPDIMGHDWSSATRVAYGTDPQYEGTVQTWQVAVRTYDEVNHVWGSAVHLIPSGSPRMSWARPQFNPSGTRVMYGYYAGGLCEVTADGAGTPTTFVARTKNAWPDRFEYVDDNTLVYTWCTSSARDVYVKARNKGATNLTGKDSAICNLATVR